MTTIKISDEAWERVRNKATKDRRRVHQVADDIVRKAFGMPLRVGDVPQVNFRPKVKA
jgi:hypothetical protein